MSFERSEIARKRRSELEEEVDMRKSCTFTYVISRFTASSHTSYAQVALSAKVVYAQKLDYTYTISRSRAQDVYRTHKSPRAHKSYTYAISRLGAKVVYSTQSRLQGAQAVQPMYVDRYKRLKQTNRILTLSFRSLYLPSLASCAVNRESPHDPVVTGQRKGQAHQNPLVSKT